MKKTLFILASAAVMLLCLPALYATPTETRTVRISGDYDELKVSGSPILNFEIGEGGNPLTVIGAAADLDNLEIEVKNNVLQVRFRKNYKSRTNTGVQVFVKNPTLKKASVSGSGRINIAGVLDRDSNAFSVSGSGRIEVERIDCREAECKVSGSGSLVCQSVKAGALTAKVSGSGRLELTGVQGENVKSSVSGSGRAVLSGKADNAGLSVSGSGRLSAENLVTGNVDAKIAGSGRINTRCTGKLNASLTGSGRINYYGKPATINASGKTRNLKEK